MYAWIGRGLALATALLAVAGHAAAQTASPPDQIAQADVQRKGQSRAPTAASVGEGNAIARVNNWTVGLAGGLPEGTFLRFAAEIARNLNDGEDLRVLAIVTPGATENVKDLLYLKGVDIGITHADVFEHFRTVEKIPNIERRINFISEMYISEVHVLVRPEINSFKDLEGKKVSFHTPGAGPSVTAPILFGRLGIKVEPVYVNNAIALEKMRSGEIAALVHTVGKPNDLFVKFKNETGFKFLPIPYDKFEDFYVPSIFTAEDYPAYVKPGEKVETIGIQAVLAVYNWPKDSDRFRRVSRFIDYYFDRFKKFHVPPYHPKWKSINLAAKVPGWTRYWVAEEKLKQMVTAPSTAPSIDPQFARQQAARAAPNDTAEQERLFQKFLEWSKTQSKR
ncbi:MAG: C4-dicarboxylate ABC transporter [Hyphomicrobiaceae bacterium]|nr:MAG: C4-dicarboxylate ABC transporter [Hyphomicrobiaceae bacterium]